jgi:hypothetical protein
MLDLGLSGRWLCRVLPSCMQCRVM